MPLPGGLARFNRSVTNRITRPLARRLPGFGLIRHEGRVSGTIYETPVNAWRHGHRIVVALTYGDDVDWLKNVLASDTSTIVMGGDDLLVGSPVRLPPDQGSALMSSPVRAALKMLQVDGFVAFPIVTGAT